MFTFLTISEADHDHKIDRAHNPPESVISKDEFDREYYKLYDKVDEILSRHGQNNAYGEGDYYLEPHILNSRGLGFEVTNSSIITPKLIKELGELIGEIDRRWEIYLRSGLFDFGIFISAKEALIWQRQDSTIQWQL